MGKRSGGFSLMETLISIVILGAMVVPTCTALVMSIRINDKTEKMLQAQLAVSSAVETLMATGYSPEMADDFADVVISETIVESNKVHVMVGSEIVAYGMTVQSADGLVSVDTFFRAAEGGSTP